MYVAFSVCIVFEKGPSRLRSSHAALQYVGGHLTKRSEIKYCSTLHGVRTTRYVLGYVIRKPLRTYFVLRRSFTKLDDQRTVSYAPLTTSYYRRP